MKKSLIIFFCCFMSMHASVMRVVCFLTKQFPVIAKELRVQSAIEQYMRYNLGKAMKNTNDSIVFHELRLKRLRDRRDMLSQFQAELNNPKKIHE